VNTNLTTRLLGVFVIALPSLALAALGVAPSTLASVGAFTAVLALVASLSPTRGQASESPELDRALDRIETDVEKVTAGWTDAVTGAQTAGRFREEFVAAVRHELKTPLNAILGFADVLLAEVDGPLTERQREDAEAIQSAGGYLKDLVEAVLLEWRPQSGAPLPMRYVDVPVLLERVARILEGQIAGRAIEIRVETGPSVGRVLADERRLRQVLVNLGTNALRATERGHVTFGAQVEGPLLRLSVRDTGSGIDPEALPTLFTAFSQAGTESSREGGSGLGLNIVRQMVEWHGGHLEIETKLGEGTRFSVLLDKDAT